MPSGGAPVYAPTTEPQVRSYTSPLRVFRKPMPQIGILLFSLIALAAGVAMIASSVGDWLEAKEFAYIQNASDENPNQKCIECINLSWGILLSGILMCIIGFVALGIYLKYANWRRNCICPCPFLMTKKQSLARQMHVQSGAGTGQGIMALNPSSDPLVAPVLEMPSNRNEEERRKLMVHNDNRECLSAEESDRMLEPDPRIVLRPMGRVEDA